MDTPIIPKKSGIYAIVCEANGMIYVGQAQNLDKRIKHHFRELNGSKHPNQYLQRAYVKYGAESFRYEVLEFCKIEILSEREIYWIAELDSKNSGFNLTQGGDGSRGCIPSKETRQRKSLSLKGRIVSPETRQRQSIALKGKTFTAEHRRKLSEAQQRRFENPEERKRRSDEAKRQYQDPEARQHSSDAANRRWANPDERKKTSDATKRYFQDSEARKRQSDASRLVWARKREIHQLRLWDDI